MKNQIKIFALFSLFCWSNLSLSSESSPKTSSGLFWGLCAAAVPAAAYCFWQAAQFSGAANQLKKKKMSLISEVEVPEVDCNWHAWFKPLYENRISKCPNSLYDNDFIPINSELEWARKYKSPKGFPAQFDVLSPLEESWKSVAEICGINYNPYNPQPNQTFRPVDSQKMEEAFRMVKAFKSVSESFINRTQRRMTYDSSSETRDLCSKAAIGWGLTGALIPGVAALSTASKVPALTPVQTACSIGVAVPATAYCLWQAKKFADSATELKMKKRIVRVIEHDYGNDKYDVTELSAGLSRKTSACWRVAGTLIAGSAAYAYFKK